MTAIWTSPKTWSTGELATAALMNTHVRDNLEYLYARSADLITMRGAVRLHVADSLGGDDSHRLVYGGVTYSSWHLCNGDTNIDGTGVNAPDLRDKFVISAGDTYTQGDASGAATQNVAHTHDGDDYAADATALTNHVHTFGTTATGNDSGGTAAYDSVTGDGIAASPHFHNIAGSTGNPGSNPTHVHTDLSTGASASGGSAALATLPPYKAAYWFICATGTASEYYATFDGDSSYINCGSDSSLDDLPLATFTVDMWVRYSNTEEGPKFISKEGVDLRGWAFGVYSDDCLFAVVTDTAHNTPYSWSNETLSVNVWHHVAAVWNSATGKWGGFAIDGVWCTLYANQALAAAYHGDASNNMVIGTYSTSTFPEYTLEGDISWVRISSGARFTVGSGFTPPDRCTAPAVDGTTLELWALDEGTGTATAASVDAGNNGTMTDCTWTLCT